MNEKEVREFHREFHEAFAGFSEAFAESVGRIEAQKRREGEDSRLDLGTAWECARVEYTWRRKYEAMRKGKGQWQALYKVVVANNRKRYENAEREKGLRLTAEGDRDEYKARWEERGRHILRLSAALSKPRGGEPAIGRTCDDHGGDLLRERDDAIACAEILRAELARARTAHTALRESLDTVRCDLETVRQGRVRLIDEIERLRGELAKSRADRPVMADEILTGLRTRGVLTIRREGSEIRDVSRCGEERNIGYLRPSSAGWNAYVYRPPGTEEFVGWYRNTEKAADAIDGSYPR